MHLSSESLPASLSAQVKPFEWPLKPTCFCTQHRSASRIQTPRRQFHKLCIPATVRSSQLSVSTTPPICWRNLPGAPNRRLVTTAQAQPHKSLFVPKWAREHQSSDEALGHSLYVPNPQLPPDGKTRLKEDELCDPMTRSCQTPMHTWESQCRACSGTGEIRSTTRGGKRTTSTCPLCSGVGVLRRTSSRIMPDVGNGNNGKTQYTLGRRLNTSSESDED
ncbi:hypothetical protein WJX74_001622 [Apatococcus lobatus]|uniref:Uncharacterized protein n=1 Tax=Apatococcus lobatus TaxID=904363 RepID=A0AAW1RQN9_9CHLO